MDKDVMKRLLREAHIPCARFQTLRRARFDAARDEACAQLATLGFPLFVKPVSSGSSVGIRRVADPATLPAAIEHAFQFDSKVIVEAAVAGREIELAVLGGSPPAVTIAGEIVVGHRDGFYSYDAKYIDKDAARVEIPAKITPDEQSRAQALALSTFQVLECDGMARVDLFLQADGQLLVNEINTIPGFTDISMYPKLWAASGVSATQLITRLIELALSRGERRAQIRHSFSAD
jgi:D-alanine-D-alanine ligase